jgi:hypothetical protein
MSSGPQCGLEACGRHGCPQRAPRLQTPPFRFFLHQTPREQGNGVNFIPVPALRLHRQ